MNTTNYVILELKQYVKKQYFKTDLTTSQKDELAYGITEAEWYLEGLLNYEEANNEHNYHNLQFVKDVYNVPVINGTISNSELLAAYTQFLG